MITIEELQEIPDEHLNKELILKALEQTEAIIGDCIEINANFQRKAEQLGTLLTATITALVSAIIGFISSIHKEDTSSHSLERMDKFIFKDYLVVDFSVLVIFTALIVFIGLLVSLIFCYRCWDCKDFPYKGLTPQLWLDKDYLASNENAYTKLLGYILHFKNSDFECAELINKSNANNLRYAILIFTITIIVVLYFWINIGFCIIFFN